MTLTFCTAPAADADGALDPPADDGEPAACVGDVLACDVVELLLELQALTVMTATPATTAARNQTGRDNGNLL
jgi:hypothetical protein